MWIEPARSSCKSCLIIQATMYCVRRVQNAHIRLISPKYVNYNKPYSGYYIAVSKRRDDRNLIPLPRRVFALARVG